jgi:hypothetical protein
VFFGILIVDGWHAYTKIVCDRQTCMAHLFIRDGENLQAARDGLSELVFQRRLKALEQRLDALLKWNNPNDTLKEVIKKVRRHKQHILTFIKHEGAPHHNSYGEYIIKEGGGVERKMSGGSMSAERARAYACIQSTAMTCPLRGISFHRFLKSSLFVISARQGLGCWLNMSPVWNRSQPLLESNLSPHGATVSLCENVWKSHGQKLACSFCARHSHTHSPPTHTTPRNERT